MAFQPSDAQGQQSEPGTFARFFVDAEPSAHASGIAGRPISRDVEKIAIRAVHDRNSEFVGLADENYKRRFPKEYAAFKATQQSGMVEGTSLSSWPPMTPSLIKNFSSYSIRSVEQLAALSEHDVTHMDGSMNASEWRERAKVFLEDAAGGAASGRLAAEVEDLKVKLDTKDRHIAELNRQLDEATRPREPSSDDATASKTGRATKP